MSDVTYKIRVNRPCRLFIDDEEVMILEESKLTKINLPEGEYLRKVIAIDNSAIFDEKVISLFNSKVDIIKLDTIELVDNRQNALPNEIFKVGDFYFRPSEDKLSVEVTHNGEDKYIFKNVIIPEQIVYGGYTYPVTGIVGHAFEGCFSLISVVIPNSVTSIGTQAFAYCMSLTSVYITDIAAWCKINFGYEANPLISAGNLYLNGELVEDLVIPNTVTSIGNCAFQDCKTITSVLIPNSVTSIGYGAFSCCSSLTSVTIPDSVTSIGTGAFTNCEVLTSVHITDIAAWCKIDFDSGANPLLCASKLYLNDELIKDLIIPNCVTSIRDRAFEGYKMITSVHIPNSVTSIGSWAFNSCSSLTSVTIPNNVTSIEDRTFLRCFSLNSVTIPKSVTSIGDFAFSDCSSLTSVHITDIAAWCKIYFGFGSNPLVYAGNLYLNGELIEDLVIPSSVTSISDRAFWGCSSLTSVTIPNSVTSIGERAFVDCSSLAKVTLFGDINIVGKNVFNKCHKKLKIYNGEYEIIKNENIKSIEDKYFYDGFDYSDWERDSAYAMGCGEEYDRQSLRDDPDHGWFS